MNENLKGVSQADVNFDAQAAKEQFNSVPEKTSTKVISREAAIVLTATAIAAAAGGIEAGPAHAQDVEPEPTNTPATVAERSENVEDVTDIETEPNLIETVENIPSSSNALLERGTRLEETNVDVELVIASFERLVDQGIMSEQDLENVEIFSISEDGLEISFIQTAEVEGGNENGTLYTIGTFVDEEAGTERTIVNTFEPSVMKEYAEELGINIGNGHFMQMHQTGGYVFTDGLNRVHLDWKQASIEGIAEGADYSQVLADSITEIDYSTLDLDLENQTRWYEQRTQSEWAQYMNGVTRLNQNGGPLPENVWNQRNYGVTMVEVSMTQLDNGVLTPIAAGAPGGETTYYDVVVAPYLMNRGGQNVPVDVVVGAPFVEMAYRPTLDNSVISSGSQVNISTSDFAYGIFPNGAGYQHSAFIFTVEDDWETLINSYNGDIGGTPDRDYARDMLGYNFEEQQEIFDNLESGNVSEYLTDAPLIRRMGGLNFNCDTPPAPEPTL